MRVLIFLLVANLVLAIGVSPSTINLENMARGDSATSDVMLSGISQGSKIHVDVSGEMADWITVKYPDTYEQGTVVRFVVNIPTDAPNGNHESRAIIKSTGKNTEDQMSIQTGVGVKILASVTGEQIEKYTIVRTDTYDIEEENPFIFSYTISNTGNVKTGPNILQILAINSNGMVAWKMNQTLRAKAEPHTKQTLKEYLPHDLKKGQYTIKTWLIGENQTYDSVSHIEVHEKGYAIKNGDLMIIETPPRLNEGETARLAAWFENTGEVPVSGKLVCEIYEGTNLLDVIESSTMRILPEDLASMIAYYKPEQPGKYKVLGYVLYEGKKSSAKETKIWVVSETQKRNRYAFVIIAALIAFVCAIVGVVRHRR